MRDVLVSKLYAMVYRFDIEAILKITIENVLNNLYQ